MLLFFFFKQKTAYEMRISDWSSDVCSSDLDMGDQYQPIAPVRQEFDPRAAAVLSGNTDIGRALHDRLDHLIAQPLAQFDIHIGMTHQIALQHRRSEERRVGKECVSTCRSRWSPYP